MGRFGSIGKDAIIIEKPALDDQTERLQYQQAIWQKSSDTWTLSGSDRLTQKHHRTI